MESFAKARQGPRRSAIFERELIADEKISLLRARCAELDYSAGACTHYRQAIGWDRVFDSHDVAVFREEDYINAVAHADRVDGPAVVEPESLVGANLGIWKKSAESPPDGVSFFNVFGNDAPRPQVAQSRHVSGELLAAARGR